jgi:hypothetical protein
MPPAGAAITCGKKRNPPRRRPHYACIPCVPPVGGRWEPSGPRRVHFGDALAARSLLGAEAPRIVRLRAGPAYAG